MTETSVLVNKYETLKSDGSSYPPIEITVPPETPPADSNKIFIKPAVASACVFLLGITFLGCNYPSILFDTVSDVPTPTSPPTMSPTTTSATDPSFVPLALTCAFFISNCSADQRNPHRWNH